MPETPSVSKPSETHTTMPVVSIIVPALNEAENIPTLLDRLSTALAPRAYEVLIIDDNSRDNTKAVCEGLSQKYPLRLIIRQQPEHGLSGAVLHGIAASNGQTIVVMDADLQHPPERVPALLEALEHGADFALGSRYIEGGSTDHEWTLFRKINSGVATILARPFSGPVLDPMSGFFALRRLTFDRAERLTPLGYKIALELMCKCRVKNVREVPIHFGLRTKGESKLSLKQQFRYLEHLSRLYDFTYPRLSPILKFLITTTIGYLVGLAIFQLSMSSGQTLVSAVATGYLISILMTAIFHVRYVRTQRNFLVTRRPWLDFLIISIAELATATATAAWLTHRAAGTAPLESFTISFTAAIIIRYILRKELLQDVHSLRRQPRPDELIGPP